MKDYVKIQIYILTMLRMKQLMLPIDLYKIDVTNMLVNIFDKSKFQY